MNLILFNEKQVEVEEVTQSKINSQNSILKLDFYAVSLFLLLFLIYKYAMQLFTNI